MPRITVRVPTTKESETTRSRNSPQYHHLDAEIVGHVWDTTQHAALHPRFSGQHDEWDEQFDQSTQWVPTDGCSTSKYWKTSTKTIGTNASNECTEFTIPRQISNSLSTCSIGSPRCSSATQIRTKYSFCPKRRTTCSRAFPQERSERLGIQSGQRSGTSTSSRICRSCPKDHRSTKTEVLETMDKQFQT